MNSRITPPPSSQTLRSVPRKLWSGKRVIRDDEVVLEASRETAGDLGRVRSSDVEDGKRSEEDTESFPFFHSTAETPSRFPCNPNNSETLEKISRAKSCCGNPPSAHSKLASKKRLSPCMCGNHRHSTLMESRSEEDQRNHLQKD